MAYFIRFLCEATGLVELSRLETVLRRADGDYRLKASGELSYAGREFAFLDRSLPGDGLYEEELEELEEEAQGGRGPAKAEVLDRLSRVCCLLEVVIPCDGAQAEEHLDLLEPLLDYLQSSVGGLVHVAGEGFYENDALVLATSDRWAVGTPSAPSRSEDASLRL